MEQALGAKEFGLIGVVVFAVLYLLYIIIKFVLKHALDNNKELIQHKISLSENILKLSANVDKSGELIAGKLEVMKTELEGVSGDLKLLSEKLKGVATTKQITSGNEDLANRLSEISDKIKLLINLNLKDVQKQEN